MAALIAARLNFGPFPAIAHPGCRLNCNAPTHNKKAEVPYGGLKKVWVRMLWGQFGPF